MGFLGFASFRSQFSKKVLIFCGLTYFGSIFLQNMIVSSLKQKKEKILSKSNNDKNY